MEGNEWQIGPWELEWESNPSVKRRKCEIAVLPWEMDDLMGETKTREDGSFTVEGCGDDLGWWNQPDPYIQVYSITPSKITMNLRWTLFANGQMVELISEFQ